MALEDTHRLAVWPDESNQRGIRGDFCIYRILRHGLTVEMRSLIPREKYQSPISRPSKGENQETPIYSVFVIVFLIIMFSSFLDMKIMLDAAALCNILSYVLAAVALFVIRYKDDFKRPKDIAGADATVDPNNTLLSVDARTGFVVFELSKKP